MKCHYEIGFNWPRNGPDLFPNEVARAARSRRIRWVGLDRERSEHFRRRVDRREVKIGLFLNTQADGVNMESPEMLLCRALKAAGALVVEDPDDAPVYADRAVQMSYLDRAGVPVPRHMTAEGWQRDRAALSSRQRSKVGPAWVARPALGMGRGRSLTSRAKYMASALSRAGFSPGQKVLILRHHRPAVLGEMELRFLVWHFFGHIAPCWFRRGSHSPELVKASDLASGRLTGVIELATRIAEITGLDWFLTEFVAEKAGRALQPLVVEPANALAGLGPGVKPLSGMPPEIVRMAAERIVEVAWRYSRGLPTDVGKTVCLGS